MLRTHRASFASGSAGSPCSPSPAAASEGPAAAAAAAAAGGEGRSGDGAADLAAVTAVGAESGLDSPEPLLVAGAPAAGPCLTCLASSCPDAFSLSALTCRLAHLA